ncbi:hypothetical protein Ancab_025832 [Ancistrocladus abbreviatus]
MRMREGKGLVAVVGRGQRNSVKKIEGKGITNSLGRWARRVGIWEARDGGGGGGGGGGGEGRAKGKQHWGKGLWGGRFFL